MGENAAMLWQTLSLVNIFVGFFGLLLVGYGLAKEWRNYTYQPVERSAPWVASVGTFLSLAIVAASVYMPAGIEHRPLELSKCITAPAAIAIALVGLFLSIKRSGNVSPHVVNGAALIGICGALFRILPLG